MKRTAILFLAAGTLLFLASCADTPTKQETAQAQASLVNLRTLEATARIREAEASKALADKVDATGAANALMLRELKGLGLGQAAPQQVAAAPPSLLGLAWQSVLQVADIALRGYGIKANRDVSLAQSNNSRDVALSTNSAFVGMGHEITTAGIAGYPYVQAPAANVTTTTLSGTGVLGSGTYTGPVTNTTTTTRTCNGGSGAAGGAGAGTTTGGAGGLGGSATGGTC